MQAREVIRQSPALVYEFFGTGLQVYAFNLGVVSQAGVQTPIYENRAFAYFLCWILAYHISGAEFNPASTIAAFIVKRDWSKAKHMGLKLISQILGGLFGVLLAYIFVKDKGTFNLKP